MIFVDTSAWLAISDRRDGNHEAALRVHKEAVRGRFGRLITTDYVMDESLTLLRKRIGPDHVAEFVQGLEAGTSVQQIWVSPGHYRSALELFLGQGNRAWSFTDCTSFVVMRELGIRDAFAFDSDFREAGFQTHPP